MSGLITRCKHCGHAIREMTLQPPGMHAAHEWEHFAEAHYFKPFYHEAEPMKWLLGRPSPVLFEHPPWCSCVECALEDEAHQRNQALDEDLENRLRGMTW